MEVLLAAGLAAVLVALVAIALTLPGRVAGAIRALIVDPLDALERAQDRLDRGVRDELARNRAEAASGSGQLRAELTQASRILNESVVKQMGEVAALQRAQLDAVTTQLARLTESSEKRLEALRATVDARLMQLQSDNARRLDEMRQTVDEKLQGTLERRLGESFKAVSERLEAVQRGLGEMQVLASGVGDLKKVLANVKVRGTWGEVQLGALLEQMLSPEQYLTNVATRRESGERVEFAVRLPGRDGEADEVLLPIDAKFPIEDYARIAQAADAGDAAGVEEATRQLELRIRSCARDIHDKYVHPPRTTDFAILFLPTEGLYAEVVRRAGLLESLQRDYKVSVAGPTTLAALLNSLQMGFRTLAIQKRSSEVWQVLGAVKAEFGKFGQVLEKVEKKLTEASNTLGDVGRRRRAIERKLRDVQELPAADARKLLPVPDDGEPDDELPDPAGGAAPVMSSGARLA